MAWLTNWSYRKSITLSRSSGAVTNYQMKLLVGESSGASGEDVDCGGLCASDFDDIRFTASDGTTLLDYWIESISGTTPNQLATIWIEFDSIGTSATTFYMYYGNAYASGVSNGDNTFLFFDDFSTSWNNPVKWTGDTSTFIVSSGILYSHTAGTIKGNVAVSGDVALRAKVQLGDHNYDQIGFMGANGNDHHIAFHNSDHTGHSSWQCSKNGASATLYSTTTIGFGAFHIFDLARILTGVDTCQGWYDGSTVGTSTTNVPTADLYAGVAAGSGDITGVDFVLVRNYVPSEPAWGSWGSQESSLTLLSFAYHYNNMRS